MGQLSSLWYRLRAWMRYHGLKSPRYQIDVDQILHVATMACIVLGLPTIAVLASMRFN